jgi:hypothetical protein
VENEEDPFLMMLNGLDAEGCGDVGLSSAWTAD